MAPNLPFTQRQVPKKEGFTQKTIQYSSNPGQYPKFTNQLNSLAADFQAKI